MKEKNKMADTEIRVVHFPPGEFEPLFVSAKDIGKVVLGVSNKTLANWRSEKKGPDIFWTGKRFITGLTTLKIIFLGVLFKQEAVREIKLNYY